MPNTVKVLSTLALMGAFRGICERYEAAFGTGIEVDFAPTVALLERLRSGECADVVILTRQALDDLAAQRSVVADSRVDLARSYVGLAVKSGAPRPDITTETALRSTLLGAGSVAYSRIGASGIFFAQLIERMGIASEINRRARIIPSGLTGELLTRGEADLAVQQVSELKLVAGVDILGTIPVALQVPMVFSGGRMTGADRSVEADRLLKFLTSVEATAVLRESGLEP